MGSRRILIVKLSSLGDVFHALPAVHCLKAGLGVDVDWVTQPEYTELVRCFPDVTEVMAFPRRRYLTEAIPFVRALRSREYDLVLDLQGLLKSAIVSKLARGAKVIGPSFRREGALVLYDAVAGPRDKNRHAVEENLDIVRYLGVGMLPVQFPVLFPVCEVAGEEPRVAVVPVSRGAAKNWPVERFAETAKRLRREVGAAVYLFGTKDDAPACEAVRSAAALGASDPGIVNLAGRTSLVEMGGWLGAMQLVIANDSGPIHMAAAVGTPVLALFGPTDAKRTGPYGAQHRVLTADVECRPCFRRACSEDIPKCLSGITVDRVVGAALEMLDVRKP